MPEINSLTITKDLAKSFFYQVLVSSIHFHLVDALVVLLASKKLMLLKYLADVTLTQIC